MERRLLLYIFRATSCMVTGLAHGVTRIKPVTSVEECIQWGEEGYVTAGERGGKKVQGLDIGNSPFEYMKENLSGKSVVVSTTNGTRTILASLEGEEVLIGAFLNIGTLSQYLANSDKNTVIHCAGWQGRVNIEDSLFAGALTRSLASTHEPTDDSALMVSKLYESHKNELHQLAMESSHARRLAGFGVSRDLDFCMSFDRYRVLPVFENGELTLR